MRLRQSVRTWWLSFSNEVKRTAMPGDRAAGAALRVVDEVVVLHLAGRDDLAGAVGDGEADAHRAPSGSGSRQLEEDAARRDVAGDAVDLAEQQRFQPHHEHLVEAQVGALLVAADVGGGAVAALRRASVVGSVSSAVESKGVTHGHHRTLSSNEVKKLTCRITHVTGPSPRSPEPAGCAWAPRCCGRRDLRHVGDPGRASGGAGAWNRQARPRHVYARAGRALCWRAGARPRAAAGTRLAGASPPSWRDAYGITDEAAPDIHPVPLAGSVRRIADAVGG